MLSKKVKKYYSRIDLHLFKQILEYLENRVPLTGNRLDLDELKSIYRTRKLIEE